VPPALLAPVRRRALDVYRRLPVPVRRAVVRWLTPRYSVGVVCVFRRDGHVLMLRQRHHAGWTLPGGLLGRGESPHDALSRELAEELAVSVALPRLPVRTYVDPAARHVDVVYVIDVPHGTELSTSADGLEVVDVAWRRPDSPVGNEATATMLALLDDR